MAENDPWVVESMGHIRTKTPVILNVDTGAGKPACVLNLTYDQADRLRLELRAALMLAGKPGKAGT